MSTGPSKGEAIVVGAGVGGLASAIALRDAGWSVRVLERSPEHSPLGAGLTLWPNAVRALRELGAAAIVDAPGTPRNGGAIRSADGSELAAYDPAEIERRYGAPLVAVHRADLHNALLERLGADAVTLGAGVSAAAEPAAGGRGVKLVDGGELEADLVVGADGLHSVVRERLCGPSEPRESGVVAFRGVAGGEGIPSAADVPAGEWWGSGSVAGLVPLRDGRVYWYHAFRGPSDGSRDELLGRVADYADPLPAIVAATDPGEVLFHGLLDRDPPERMAGDGIALVGDAAHPMPPFLGQGACAAIEDAVALGAALLAAGGDTAAGLERYDAERVPRARGLVKGSRRAERLALAANPVLRAVRNAAVRAAPKSARLRQLDSVVSG